jgi:glutathione synthase/RimK-type ligase-like ATP-grasp enzyme
MKRLIILIDEDSEFLVSKADLKNFTSMDIDRIKNNFISMGFAVSVFKFSEFDLNEDYHGVYILYQTSEADGGFYKRYIEDLIYFLEKQGAFVLPKHELLKAHHDKVFMELLRLKFSDNSLKTIKSWCYGSWRDAKNYNSQFPVVVKRISTTSGKGVFLANNRTQYLKRIKEAGKVIMALDIMDLFVLRLKKIAKKVLKFIYPYRAKYVKYNTTPLSYPIVVQNFINGLSGDYKVLIFGRKYYSMYRKNRENDFRASGSGQFYEVPYNDQVPLLTFARKITAEIDFPIFGIDIGFDGKEYHLLEFQMIQIGTSAIQRAKFWYEFNDGKWNKHEGQSSLEDEFTRAIDDYITLRYN